MAKVKMKKDGYKQMKPSEVVKPGKGEMGKPLRKNYMKEQVKMAEGSTLYKKKK